MTTINNKTTKQTLEVISKMPVTMSLAQLTEMFILIYEGIETITEEAWNEGYEQALEDEGLTTQPVINPMLYLFDLSNCVEASQEQALVEKLSKRLDAPHPVEDAFSVPQDSDLNFAPGYGAAEEQVEGDNSWYFQMTPPALRWDFGKETYDAVTTYTKRD